MGDPRVRNDGKEKLTLKGLEKLKESKNLNKQTREISEGFYLDI